jgi:hypothetical protein
MNSPVEIEFETNDELYAAPPERAKRPEFPQLRIEDPLIFVAASPRLVVEGAPWRLHDDSVTFWT